VRTRAAAKFEAREETDVDVREKERGATATASMKE